MLRPPKNVPCALLVTVLSLSIFAAVCMILDGRRGSEFSKSLAAIKILGVNEPYQGDLELPVAGATGYASVALDLKSSPRSDSQTIERLKAGIGFTVVREEGDWWLVQNKNQSGWLPHKYCLINLPDVIPSIIYDNTNTYSSRLVSSGKNLPGITGYALYSGKSYNARVGKDEFIMPVLYSMAKKIHLAQQSALIEGNALKIYEAYRPHTVQKRIVNALNKLAGRDAAVMKGINTPVWDISWFIATDISNHQRGNAIDVSLVKITSKKEIAVGPYSCTVISGYEEFTMPTPIHELSMASARFTVPVTAKSATAWQEAKFAKIMNEAAIRLQAYCTNAGLIPLASEWWHFDDLEARLATAGNSSVGDYTLLESYSLPPRKQTD